MNIPPLRERKEDIPVSGAITSLRKLAPETGCRVESITDAAMEKLVKYHWPGNVRELENVIERSLVMAAGTELDAADIKLENAPRPRARSGDSHFLPEGMSSINTSRTSSAKRCAAPTATRARPRACSA